MSRFCAICGKPISDKAPHFGMCLECYLKEHPLFELPDTFSLKICPNCFSYAKKQKWFDSKIKDIFSIVENSIQKFLLEPNFKEKEIKFNIFIDESSLDYNSKDLIQALNVKIKGTYAKNSDIKHTEEMKINIDYELCDNCQKLMSGENYSSIIQIRVKSEKEFNLIKDILNQIQYFVEDIFKKDPKHYISKMVDQKYGVDLYLSTNELMNYIISFLKGKYPFLLKRSKKLVGRDSQKGKNIYRLKALIKFLPFDKNEILLINNTKFKVETILKNKVILKNQNGEKVSKKFNYFFNKRYKIINKTEI
jgi:NMD protein affecting ribosome stability and mRNA decay